MPDRLHTIQTEALLLRFKPLLAIFYDSDFLLPCMGSITQDKNSPHKNSLCKGKLPMTPDSNMITLILSYFNKWLQKTGYHNEQAYSSFSLSCEEITTIKLAVNMQSSTSGWDKVLHIQYINTYVTQSTHVLKRFLPFRTTWISSDFLKLFVDSIQNNRLMT